jgi:hypothetical protein
VLTRAPAAAGRGRWQAPALVAGCLAAVVTASVLTVLDLHGRPPVGSIAGFSPGGGFTQLSDAELDGDLDAVVRSGARWIRVDLAWTTVERGGGPVRLERVRPGGRGGGGP